MRKFIDTFKTSIRGLLTNKIRSFLTILGIIIGIGSVIGLMGIGAGAQVQVEESIATLGTDIITIAPGGGGFGPQDSPVQGGLIADPLTEDDFDYLDNPKRFPDIASISPVVQATQTLTNQSNEFMGTVRGVNDQYAEIQELNVTNGRFLKEADIDSGRFVVVIGPDVVAELFPYQTPEEVIGENIFINNIRYQVIGIPEAKGGTGFSNPDENIFLPYTTAISKITESDYLSQIQLQVTNEDTINLIISQITDKLAKFRDVDPEEPDFTIFSSDQLLDIASEVTAIFTTLLASIAGISLLVGGIGISNIMLVSVTERTREIGLRKAVGARKRDILYQFLSEAVILTVLGGIFGIILGYLLGLGIGTWAGIDSAITLNSILLATGVSAGIGLIFGFTPAYQASRLDPIDALRYE